MDLRNLPPFDWGKWIHEWQEAWKRDKKAEQGLCLNSTCDERAEDCGYCSTHCLCIERF